MSWHALARYRSDNKTRTAMVLEDQLYDLQQLVDACAITSTASKALLLSGIGEMISRWDEAENVIADLAAATTKLKSEGKLPAALGEAKNHPALTLPFMPSQIFAAGSNYVEHAHEMGTVLAAKADSKPYMFLKATSSVIGPGENVVIPSQVKRPDWEVELGVVIGRGGRRIPVESSMDHVAGYVVVNDVSARDQTRREDYPFKFDWFQGKSFDTFAPVGPWFVPRACIDDPQSLKLGMDINREPMQNGSAAEMIWTIREQIAYLSTIVTLQPGNLIATGTPTGVGMGRGIFLKPGDNMRAWVESIGELCSPVVAETGDCS